MSTLTQIIAECWAEPTLSKYQGGGLSTRAMLGSMVVVCDCLESFGKSTGGLLPKQPAKTLLLPCLDKTGCARTYDNKADTCFQS